MILSLSSYAGLTGPWSASFSPILASPLTTEFLDTGVLCHIWIFTGIQVNEHSKQAWIASAFKLWGISLPSWHNIFLQIINKLLWNSMVWNFKTSSNDYVCKAQTVSGGYNHACYDYNIICLKIIYLNQY